MDLKAAVFKAAVFKSCSGHKKTTQTENYKNTNKSGALALFLRLANGDNADDGTKD